MIWFGVGASISAPELTKMRRPSIDEGVERAVVDDDDLDVLLGEPGRLQDRLRVVAQQLLDLGVADDRQAASALRLRRTGRCRSRPRDAQCAISAHRARCWPSTVAP